MQQQSAPFQVTEPTLPKDKTRIVQSVVGSLLYYARAIDCTMLPALNELSKSQAIQNRPPLTNASNALIMQIHTETLASDTEQVARSRTWKPDAAYLVLPKAKSRVAGYYYMGHNREA